MLHAVQHGENGSISRRVCDVDIQNRRPLKGLNMSGLRILWHSVPSRFNTGYGCQTRLWTKALKAQGHEMFISSVAGSMPTYDDENGILTLSQGTRQMMGNDWIQAHVLEVKPDIVLSMMDTFVVDCKKFRTLPWYAWQVVDAAPLLPRLHPPCRAAKGNLAMSRFGQRVMEEAGIKSTYVPLAFDPLEYYPQDREESRAALEKTLGVSLKGAYLIVMNSANMSQPSRKNFGCAFKAFAEFRKQVPSAVLYCHTERTGQMARGENLLEAAKQYHIDTKILWPQQYAYTMGMIGTDFLRGLYNAADVFLHTALGEGFGLPLVEAAACGCPVIAPEFSASGELVENGYMLTKNEGVMHMMWTGVEQFIADPACVTSALHYMHNKPAVRTPTCQQFDIYRVLAEHFNPWLSGLPQSQPKPKGPSDETEDAEAIQEPDPARRDAPALSAAVAG